MTKNQHELKRFVVRLTLFGVKKDYDPTAVADIEEELRMRPHINAFQVNWENESQPVDIEVEIEGLDEKGTSMDMAEELFEVANAVLRDIEGMHVVVKEVYQKS
jgi:hypothetical protein